jgi:hypothetical protein
MFAYEQIIYQPAFYFLIAITITLTIGYTWGRRLNRRIVVNALDPLLEVFKARDQQFTNIGGQTGFHANIVPGNMRGARRIDVTLTVLPRQSWLYMPISLLVRKFDRFHLTVFFNKRGKKLHEEAHLIDTRFEKMAGNRIEHADRLSRREVDWGPRVFALYSSGEDSEARLRQLMERYGEPGPIRHVAILPDEERAYFFQIPRVGTVAPNVAIFRDWIDEYVDAVSHT